MIKKLITKLRQLVCDHVWSRARGYHDAPAENAVCLKCGKKAAR